MIIPLNFQKQIEDLTKISILKGLNLVKIVGNSIGYQIDKREGGFIEGFVVFQKENNYFLLRIKTHSFEYNEMIGDEIESLKFSISQEDENSIKNTTLDNSGLFLEEFKINKIILIGEDRKRIWSERKKTLFFKEPISYEIADELKTLEMIIFQDEFENQFVFRAYHGCVSFYYTKSYQEELMKYKYDIDDVDMTVMEKIYSSPNPFDNMKEDNWPIKSDVNKYKIIYEV